MLDDLCLYQQVIEVSACKYGALSSASFNLLMLEILQNITE